MARVAVIDSSVMSRERLRALRNCGDITAKNAQITTNAITSENSRSDLFDCIKEMTNDQGRMTKDSFGFGATPDFDEYEVKFPCLLPEWAGLRL